MIDFDNLVAPKLVGPTSGQTMHDSWGYRPAVSMSSEMRRILALPRRDLELDGTERAETIIDMETERFARPDVPGRKCRCAELDPERHAQEGCITRLRLPQAMAIREIRICGGLLGPIGVGFGKTLIDLLAPFAFQGHDAKLNKIVLLLPPGLAAQLEGDYKYYGQHFDMPQIVFHGIDYSNTCAKMDNVVPLKRGAPVLHVVPYSRLSRPESTVWLETVLKPDAIVSDECFPGDTLVHTDEGELSIGEIVEQGRGRHALSYNTESGTHVWRKITKRLRRDGDKPLVRVTHEHGSFVCTEDHKIWISDGRYVQAKNLTSENSLVRATVREVRHDLLHAEQREIDRPVLLKELRRERGAQGEEVTRALGSETVEADRCGGSDTGATRGVGGGSSGQDVSRTRRERSADESATVPPLSAGPGGRGDGARRVHTSGTRSLLQSAFALQGGHRDPGRETSDRGGRKNTPDQEVEVSRSTQDRDPQLSRVARVEVLERGGADGHGSCRIGDPVYDLTVEGEHNYFANGVLVSNCHKLRNIETATGARVRRYMEDVAPHTRFAALSGSMTAKKIQDYWHLAKWALRTCSPLPTDKDNVDTWGTALNPSGNPANPGPLMQLCREGEHLYDGFKRRIAETVGVVTTTAPAVDVALVLLERAAPPIPTQVRDYLKMVRGQMPGQEGPQRPDGEELLTALEASSCAMQIACGFYYRWIYPRCEFPRDEELVKEWREKRRAYFKEVRAKLKSLDEHMDSPRLVMNAAERHYGLREKRKGLPTWDSKHFMAWQQIRGRVYAETQAVLFNDYLVRDCLGWAEEYRGVIWYEHDALGQWISDLSKQTGQHLPKYGGGKAAKEQMLGSQKKGIPGEDGSRSIICSIKAHGTGTNGLQHRFHDAMMLNPMADPNGWEQVLGRVHRPGQSQDVRTFFYRHTPETKAHLDAALVAAGYVENTGFGNQKILRAWSQ